MQMQDERLTFLLPRPIWVNDMDVTHCLSCNNAFGALRRRHHCRHCGNIFCHDCSSRSVPLPQLGYGSKPVRVCNNCFEVAYLVTYAIDEDHGLTTQMHGARGLLEMTERDNELELHNMVVHGGVDALIWLCRSSINIQLHHLITTILAMLAEKESIRPVIITKWALPPLLHLIRHYAQLDKGFTADLKEKRTSVISSQSSLSGTTSDGTGPHSVSPHVNGGPLQTDTDHSEIRQSMMYEILINCTHILYQLSRAGILSQKEIVNEGVFDGLLVLSTFEPINSDDHRGTKVDNETIASEEDALKDRITIVQNLAAKAISAISASVTTQPSIIDILKGSDKLPQLLRSNNEETRKYIAKTMAYLSLRNDKYKSSLLEGDGARALMSIIALLPQMEGRESPKERMETLSIYMSKKMDSLDGIERPSNATGENVTEQSIHTATVSHACCALANFATNNVSQKKLMDLPLFLEYLCNVPAIFPSNVEIHRHVARCLANLAAHDGNTQRMIQTDASAGDQFSVIPTLLAMAQSSNAVSDIQRHILRALDNLSSTVPSNYGSLWHTSFKDAYAYVSHAMESNADPDMLKRAQSFMDRVKQALENNAPSSLTSAPTASSVHKESTEATDQEPIEEESIDEEPKPEPKIGQGLPTKITPPPPTDTSPDEESTESTDHEPVEADKREKTKGKKVASKRRFRKH
ncbi:armadillo-type protein [Radiomyces spectabilis]|uniref:armadillo-type protein n=1 Tax=Radiomyces spectabilis TaxID=64574 RepID=UPI00221ED840|nr:armadillo-type protein [Radiomyces spectabilis]KAI8393568.1 armadillo-type protein [Radiomyces spectabilis]